MSKEGTPFAVTIEERDFPNHKVTAELHDKPPIPKEGGGGWEVVRLPKRSAVLVWKGRGLMQMAVPIVFDTGNSERPLGSTFDTLLHMWRPTDPTDEPPVLEISSPGDALPYAELEWVIDDLEWGEAVADHGGNKIQQSFVVILREYRADERLQTAQQSKGKKTKARYYRVKRKDLAHGLVGIAHHLHLKGGWRELGLAQHPQLHDPRQGLHVGQLLVIPVTTKTGKHSSITVGANFAQP